MNRTLIFVWLITLFLSACAPAATPAPAATTLSTLESPPSWFGAGTSTTRSLSAGEPYAFDEAGNITGDLPKDQVTCTLRIWICDDKIFKQKVINQGAGERCPDSLQFSHAPQTKVDCAKWDEAKRTKDPCDPLVDADCDGVTNDLDEWPLDFYRQ